MCCPYPHSVEREVNRALAYVEDGAGGSIENAPSFSVVRSYELSANAYLTKPVDPSEFIDIILSTERYWLSIVQLPTDTDLD